MTDQALGTDGFPKSGWTPPDTGVQLAPGGAAAAQAAGYAPPAPVPQPAPVAAASAPAPAPAAAIKPTVAVQPKTYTLTFPVQEGEATHSVVTIRNLRAGDLGKIDRAVGPRARENVLLLLGTPDGRPISGDVFDAMDYGDGAAIVDLAEPLLQRAMLPKVTARFAGADHARSVELAAPVDLGGRVFDVIEVRRLTARQISDHFSMPADRRGMLPAFFDVEGTPVPDAVIEALSFEDTEAVGEAMDAFMPGALKADRAPAPSSAPETGETSPLS